MLWHDGKQVEAVAYVRNSGIVTIEYKDTKERLEIPWDQLTHENGLAELAGLLRRVRHEGERRG